MCFTLPFLSLSDCSVDRARNTSAGAPVDTRAYNSHGPDCGGIIPLLNATASTLTYPDETKEAAHQATHWDLICDGSAAPALNA